VISIAGSAISATVGVRELNDVLRIYAATERDGRIQPGFTGPDFPVRYDKPFQQSEMRSLFQSRRQRALRGDAWLQRPPF
jgi:hypothetical protein